MNLSRLFKTIFLVEFVKGLYMALKDYLKINNYPEKGQ